MFLGGKGKRERRAPRRYVDSREIPASKWRESLPESPVKAKEGRSEQVQKKGLKMIRISCSQGLCLREKQILDQIIHLAVASSSFFSVRHLKYIMLTSDTINYIMQYSSIAENRLIGGACARRARKHVFQIVFIAIDQRCRRQCLGSVLLRRLLYDAQKKHAKFLVVYATDSTSAQFFARSGFSQDTSALPEKYRSHFDTCVGSILMIHPVNANT